MIYVLGSLNIDLSATLSHMPKAGETMTADDFSVGCGGKGGNQACAIGKLGGDVSMIGCVGSDTYGKMLKGGLEKFGVRTDGVRTVAGSSGTALIWVHKGNNRIVLSPGANACLTPEDADRGLAGAKAGDVLVTQLEVPLPTVAHAMQTAHRLGLTTVLNPAPAVPLPPEMYEYADIIAPNESETEILTGIDPDCEVNVALAVKKLRAFGARAVVLTLGSSGSAVAVGQEITLVPARKVRVVDTTAAGDTFLGAMCVRLHRGEDLISAANFATAASALKITRRGASAVIPTLEEVETYICSDGA